MRKVNEVMRKMHIKTLCAIQNFRNSERGDTNFVSMLIIIGIVVVLAGLFLVLGKDIMTSISQKVKDFINAL